ncbi:MAG: thioredoxin domain-containing protein [Myxococcota bacterium]|nr:thioredoxin domain-containing protein [Myxococcota bacterium]
MKKESLVIAVALTGAVAFFLGRMSVSTKDAPSPSAAEQVRARSAQTAEPAAVAPPAESAKAQPAAAAPAAQPAAVAAKPAAAKVAPKPAAVAQPVKRVPPTRPAPGVAVSSDSPTKGAENAKVTIIEISDFQCPFCSRVNPTIKQIMETYGKDVAVTFKHNALSFHKRARPAAVASLAAHRQGKFWEYHDKLFANQRALEDANLEQYATELGLDLEKFKADVKDPKLGAQADNEQKSAVALGQGGTPAFLINGKALSGAQPFDKFKAVIETEITEADKLIDAGTAPKDVHMARAKVNLGPKFSIYQGSLVGGKPAPAAPARKPKARPVDKTVWKVDLMGHEATKGPEDALVTIVEYSDFQCPFCSKVNPTIAQIVKTYGNDVRIVWKNNALPFHKRALPAARASYAAQLQGKFWEYHDKLFANQRALEDADLERYATEIGLDIAKFKKDFASAESKSIVDKDMELATKVNARGTPNFFVNGRNLRGAVPFENFKTLIDEELGKAKRIADSGVARKDVYAQIIAKGKTFEPLDSKVTKFDLEGRPFKGAENGDIVIAEFSDFQCPYCGRIAPTLKKLTEDPELKDRVKVVFKQFPLSFHKQAKPAAVAALAAHQQGKFWEFHDKNFANMKSLTDENFKKWAGEIGLDMAKFDAYIASGEGEKIITGDMNDGRKAGVRGTPSVYINGRKFQPTGGYSVPAIKQILKKYFPKK